MIKLFRDTDIGGSLSGGPAPIPEDVRKKIDKFAKYYVLRRLNLEEDIRYCVEHGYSLSLPTIQAQEERIRVLEEALNKIEILIENDETEDPGQILFDVLRIASQALTPKTNKP